MTFTKDLAIGRSAEKEFAKVLLDTKQIISLEFAQGKFKDWDIKIDCVPDWILTYEIKSDTMAEDTGNYVIEYMFKWKPSWIYTSKADYIVYYIKWEWWIAERGALILWLMNTEKRDTKWWDWRASSLWVLKCETLPNLFNKIEVDG